MIVQGVAVHKRYYANLPTAKMLQRMKSKFTPHSPPKTDSNHSADLRPNIFDMTPNRPTLHPNQALGDW